MSFWAEKSDMFTEHYGDTSIVSEVTHSHRGVSV